MKESEPSSPESGLRRRRILLLRLVADLIVDGVFFFEVFEVLFVGVEFGVGIGGTRDLVDGHLADHGAEIGGAFEGLLFVEVVHLFDGAGVEGVASLFFDELFFMQDADGGVRCVGAEDGSFVMDGPAGSATSWRPGGVGGSMAGVRQR